jgi:hypothetical protein
MHDSTTNSSGQARANENQDSNYMSFKLHAVPTNPDSQLYSLSELYYTSGTPEQWILFRKNLSKVLVGQNITTGPPTYAMTWPILKGSSLAKFEESMLTHRTETLEHFNEVLNNMGSYEFPRWALQMEKHYMHLKLKGSLVTKGLKIKGCTPTLFNMRNSHHLVDNPNDVLSPYHIYDLMCGFTHPDQEFMYCYKGNCELLQYSRLPDCRGLQMYPTCRIGKNSIG